MRFERTGIEGAFLVEIEPHHDERGFFARRFCEREFAAAGLETRFVQHSLSHSIRRHTLRGMHFQKAPHGEVKLVGCAAGAIFDVVADLRPGSPSFRQWRGFELSAENGRSLYIPQGCAHGFLTLSDDAVTTYMISAFHAPEAAAGVRFDDPALGIDWPAEPAVLSERDRQWPALEVDGEGGA